MARATEHKSGVGPASEVLQVTIVKCDLVDSTRIKSGLDLQGQADFDEGWKNIVRPLEERFGAHVESYEGDGAFLTFGRFRQREDTAEAALRMAQALVADVQKSQLAASEELRVRVGVASGAIASINAPLPSVAGLTIDIAERLRAAADPNQILLCGETRRRASGFFEYDDLGLVPAKGFEGGIPAWRLGSERPVSSRFEALRSQGPVVGRAKVLKRLTDLWTGALAGRPQAAWLVGDAGIGKSRLASSVRALADASRAVTLTIDCSPSTLNTPLFPVGVLLQRSAGVTSRMSPADATAALRSLLETLVPQTEVDESLDHLAPLLGPQSETAPPAPAAADGQEGTIQEKTIAILVRIVAGLVADRPGLVLCEDLHWADDSTLQLIARLHAGLEDRRVLFLMTSRGPPREPISGLSSLVTIAVEPLAAKASEELVRGLSGGAHLSDESVAAIVARCEGVPLLIEEVTRSALEQPHVETAPATGASESGVPVPLQLVVETRLAQCGDVAQIARAASVLGREVHVPLLASLAAADPSAASAALRRLNEEGLLDRYEQGDRARFRHAMICEAVYATVMPREREAWHSRVADALLGAFAGTTDATPDVLAEHLRKAGRFRESIDTRLQAAADNAARGAYVESEGHCRAALRLVSELPDRDEARGLEFRLLVQLGVAQTGRLGYSAPEVEETYLKAHAVCGDDAEAEALYPILRALTILSNVRGMAAYDLSVQALEVAQRSGNVAYVIDAMTTLCFTTFDARSYAECLDWIERALTLYDLNDGDALIYPAPQNAGTAALAQLPTALWMTGEPEAAERALQRGIDHVERLGRDFDRAFMELWVAGLRITQKRWLDAVRHSRIAFELSGDFAIWRDISAISLAAAEANVSRDMADVRRAIAALDAYEATGVASTVPYYCLQVAHACVAAGELALARQFVERGRARAERSKEPRMIAELMILEASLEEDDERACDVLKRAFALADSQGSIAVALRAAATLAQRCRLPEAEFASATLDILEGGVAPQEEDWMRKHLAVLRGAVRQSPAAAGT